jgi:hypothetical protein
VAASLGSDGAGVDPSGKKNPKQVAAGTMLYRSDPGATGYTPLTLTGSHVTAGGAGGAGGALASSVGGGRAIELMHCPGRVASYSGAYLVTRSLFLKVDYAIKNHLEAASMNTFGAADYAMKVRTLGLSKHVIL